MKRFRNGVIPLFLLALAGLAYGLWATRLGIYWDDVPITWIYHTYGASGLTRYFSTNRPVWGLLYQLTVPVLGMHALAWHILAILGRWLSGVLLWRFLLAVWRDRKDFATWAAALFILYPGFSQQFIPVVYSHFFIVLNVFLGSFLLSVLAVRQPRRRLIYSLLAWALGLANLLFMEYFFFLELTRPLWLAVVIWQESPAPRSLWQTLKRAFILWLPYLGSLVGVMLWRALFFGYGLYRPIFYEMLAQNPLNALAYWLNRTVQDAILTAVMAWGNAFQTPGAQEMVPRLLMGYYAVVGTAFLLGLAVIWLTRTARESAPPRPRLWVTPFLLGLAGLTVAGVPYWLTGLPVQLYFHADRFTLSFMLSAVLVTCGLFFALPLPRGLRLAVLSVFLAFSVGYQYRSAVVYLRDWVVMQRMFWQLSWRMPALQPGTTLLSNELPMRHYSDNSLTAPLNWMYAPDNTEPRLRYILFYPTVRLGANLPGLEKGLPFELDYLAATFQGNTAQAVTFWYKPPACVRVLDPEIDIENWTLPIYLRDAMAIHDTAPILPQGNPYLPEILFGTEPQPNWCYYFEKADLARQQKDWEAVARWGEQAFATGDYPNDPLERFPFIEAYAHLGEYDRAMEQTRLAGDISPVYQRLLCRLWRRIEREAPPTPEKDASYQQVMNDFACDEPFTPPPGITPER